MEHILVPPKTSPCSLDQGDAALAGLKFMEPPSEKGNAPNLGTSVVEHPPPCFLLYGPLELLPTSHVPTSLLSHHLA